MSWLGKFAGAALGAVGSVFANRQQSKQFAANYGLAKDQLYRHHQMSKSKNSCDHAKTLHAHI